VRTLNLRIEKLEVNLYSKSIKEAHPVFTVESNTLAFDSSQTLDKHRNHLISGVVKDFNLFGYKKGAFHSRNNPLSIDQDYCPAFM